MSDWIRYCALPISPYDQRKSYFERFRSYVCKQILDRIYSESYDIYHIIFELQHNAGNNKFCLYKAMVINLLITKYFPAVDFSLKYCECWFLQMLEKFCALTCSVSAAKSDPGDDRLAISPEMFKWSSLFLSRQSGPLTPNDDIPLVQCV